MERRLVERRLNWQQKCEEVGFSFYDIEGTYWHEGVCYCFTAAEIDELEEATETLQQMCLELVERVIAKSLFSQLDIPPQFAQLCQQSWQRKDRSLYGRFDLAYDGQHPPKLLEYNADTPTALLESSVVQWAWLEEMFPEADQFNSLHEKLLAQFESLHPTREKTFYFACEANTDEDVGTVEYLRDLAIQAQFKTQHIFIDEIGWDAETEKFCDLQNQPIELLFKLYPWEWMIQEDFGQYLLKEPQSIFEPPWKMILSNKGILPLLWEMFPNHKYLLPSYFDSAHLEPPYISKPLFSREGENITIYRNEGYRQMPNTTPQETLIFQDYYPLPNFANYYPVIGSWIVGEEAAGIGIREDRSIITQDSSLFVPHLFY
ncbi:MAG: glutathionylspermidine synthase family protein [Spirulinaceae cyanobacterium]